MSPSPGTKEGPAVAAAPESPEEVLELRRCVRDLVALTALPAIWIDEPAEVIGGILVDALCRALRLDLLYLRLEPPRGGPPIELARAARRQDGGERGREIGAALGPWLRAAGESRLPPSIPNPVGEGTLRLAVTPIGYGDAYGLLAAGSRRPQFPNEHDRLLLRVAANEAAIALHGAHLSVERDRAEAERAGHLAREQAARADAERARAAAEAERRRLRDLLSRVPAVIFVTHGSAHVFRFANPMLERVTGRDVGDLLGRPAATVFPEIVGQGYFELLDRVYATGTPVFGQESYLRWGGRRPGARPDGFFSFAFLPMRGAGGEVEGVLVHAVDVTEQVDSRHRVEELVLQLQDERTRLEALVLENARLYEESRGKAALEERQRLARELHDSVSQALYGIALNASAAEAVRQAAPDRLGGLLSEVLVLAEAGLAEMRALIFELRPESLEQEGLVAALQKQAAAVRARHGIDVQCTVGSEPPVPLAVKEALYRIAQEALQNAARHAGARRVELVLEAGVGELVLRIGDDGRGFDPRGQFPGHLGLRSMQERAAAVGGSLEVESEPGRGARVQASVPVARD